MIDVKKVKKDFPIFKERPNLIYLDTTASSLKPQRVIDKVTNYYKSYGVNVHRGVYNLSYEATNLYEDARSNVAKFINAFDDEIIFTRGTTQSLNFIASSYLDKLTEEDEIVTSELEHHSSFLPWLNVSNKTKAKLRFVELDSNGDITIENLKKVVNKNTKVIALTYVSNVMGRIMPVKEIAEVAKSVGAITIIDAAQAVAHFKVDVKDLDIDFLAFSGHKMMGPSGIGVLYAKRSMHDVLEPFEYGGEMVDFVTRESATYKKSPIKFEAGTPIIAGAIGISEAINYILELGYENITNHIKSLNDYTYKQLKEIEGITIYNESDTGIINFNIDDVHPHDAATFFDSKEICIRAGEHCAQLIIKWLKTFSTLRASFYVYNDKSDVDQFIKVVKEVKEFFQRF